MVPSKFAHKQQGNLWWYILNISVNQDWQLHPAMSSLRKLFPENLFPNRPYLPAEIVLRIVTDPCLEYCDLFRLSCVNRNWRSLISGTPETQALMFLSSSRNAPILPSSLQSDPVIIITQPDLPRGWGVKSHKSDRLVPRVDPWDHVELHPWLEEFLVCSINRFESGQRLPDQPIVSYQLLNHCYKECFQRLGATWRKMFVTQPPFQRLILKVKTCSCCARPLRCKIYYPQFTLQNQKGVTFGDVIDAIVQARLPHNAGLVENDGKCSDFLTMCSCWHYTRLGEGGNWPETIRARAERQKALAGRRTG
ncbi:hypothetical protein B0T12DRAFT_65638 [Alternaria alternata]|jgi:hypothetical protein|nr:hypothetical protein B0T12DRAFT_65638 [Alternaria alternata]